MSRIFGIVSATGLDRRAELLASMKNSVLKDSSWSSESGDTGAAGFVWCGWRTPNIAMIDGTLVVMDGVIYNYPDDKLNFDTDALLFLNLYRKFGFDSAVQRISGDLSIALYDANEKTLWLARDRMGVKPLYYAYKDGNFAFSSQPGPLLNLPGVSSAVNKRFVALFAGSHYRYFDNDPETSPYADISQLPASQVLCFKDNALKSSTYWSLQDDPDFLDSEDVLAGRYRELLIDAVDVRLKRSSKPCFTLSGGMDSSSVLASAVLLKSAKQHAFSSVYVDKTYDESDEIRSMLSAAVERWHSVVIDNPDVYGLVKQMVAAHDEPVATATWLSHLLVCKDIRDQGFDGVFGGLGGDELNAGEYEYFTYFFADLRSMGEEERLSREVEYWIKYHNHPIFTKSRQVLEENLRKMVDLDKPGVCLPEPNRLNRYVKTVNKDYFDLAAFSPRMDHPFKSYLKNRAYQDLFRETVPCCLRAEDRQATAQNLENFLPFFDYRLVEFMFRVPGILKYRDGVTKSLLRKAMVGILPEETRTRVKKTGWNAPAHMWFAGRGEQLLQDLVNSRSFKERGIYSVPEVLRLIAEHKQIVAKGLLVENHMMFFWQLVNLELWFRSLDRE